MKLYSKLLIVSGLFSLLAINLFAASGSVLVSTNSMKLLGADGMRYGAASYATNHAYAQGELITSGGANFMAVVAGTSATNPLLGPSGTKADVTDGTVVWRPVLRGQRNGFVIVNAGTNALYVNDSGVKNTGVQLQANGGAWTVSNSADVPHGEIYCNAAAATTNLTVLSVEW